MNALLRFLVVHPPLRFSGFRRVFVIGVALVSVVIAPAPNAFAARDPLSDAQARITAAQEAADNAAAAYDAAQAHYYQLQNVVLATRSAIASLRVDHRRLVTLVRQRAVDLYMGVGVGAAGLDVFRTSGDVLDVSRRTTLGAAANARSNVAIGQLRAATDDLNAREESLRSQLDDAKNALDDIRAQQRELERAVNDATRAEQQLRAQLERERRLQEYAALVREAQAAARTRAAQQADAARDAAATTDDSPSEPAPATDEGPPQIIGSGDWVCPVQGGVSFTDTWGAPRSGGRSHKGVDMFAARGTPTVAVVAGSVFFQSDPLGGLAAYVTGNDGTTYYYAHLNDYVGGDRTVSAGELIAHVGNTGDAIDAPPHVHFEIRPGGPNGTAINPYPTVRSYC